MAAKFVAMIRFAIISLVRSFGTGFLRAARMYQKAKWFQGSVAIPFSPTCSMLVLISFKSGNKCLFAQCLCQRVGSVTRGASTGFRILGMSLITWPVTAISSVNLQQLSMKSSSRPGMVVSKGQEEENTYKEASRQTLDLLFLSRFFESSS